MKKISLGKLVGGILAGAKAGAKESAACPWRPEGQPYPRLTGINDDTLRGRHGLYAIWHLGVRPQWLRVGAADDLGGALKDLVALPWVVEHEGNAGVFAAWAFVTPEQSPGMVRYLAEKLRPAFQDESLDPAIVPITISLPPGTR